MPASKALGYTLLAYLLSYLLLMHRNLPAYDSNGNVAFDSSYRFALQDVRSSITLTVGKVTFFNYIYYPADLIYYRLTNQ